VCVCVCVCVSAATELPTAFGVDFLKKYLYLLETHTPIFADEIMSCLFCFEIDQSARYWF
jgi:hypothetical protein